MGVKSRLHPPRCSVYVVDVKVVGEYISGAGSIAVGLPISGLLKDIILDLPVKAAICLHSIANGPVAYILVKIAVANLKSRSNEYLHMASICKRAPHSLNPTLVAIADVNITARARGVRAATAVRRTGNNRKALHANRRYSIGAKPRLRLLST